MNRVEFMKTFGMGVATASVAPSLFKSDKTKKSRNVINIQPPESYIKKFNRDNIVIYEDTEFELSQGRIINGRLYPVDPEKPFKAVEKINVGNFKPQLLFSIVGSEI